MAFDEAARAATRPRRLFARRRAAWSAETLLTQTRRYRVERTRRKVESEPGRSRRAAKSSFSIRLYSVNSQHYPTPSRPWSATHASDTHSQCSNSFLTTHLGPTPLLVRPPCVYPPPAGRGARAFRPSPSVATDPGSIWPRRTPARPYGDFSGCCAERAASMAREDSDASADTRNFVIGCFQTPGLSSVDRYVLSFLLQSDQRFCEHAAKGLQEISAIRPSATAQKARSLLLSSRPSSQLLILYDALAGASALAALHLYARSHGRPGPSRFPVFVPRPARRDGRAPFFRLECTPRCW